MVDGWVFYLHYYRIHLQVLYQIQTEYTPNVT